MAHDPPPILHPVLPSFPAQGVRASFCAVLCAIPLCSLVATQPTRAYVTKLYLCCFVLRQSETGRSMLCRTWYCCSF